MSRPSTAPAPQPIDQAEGLRPIDHMPRCQARRTNGTPCRSPAMKGQTVCRSHGGSAPQSRTAAALRIATEEAATVLRSLGEPVPTHPLEGLQDAMDRTAAGVRALGAEIGRRERIAVEAGQDAAAAWEMRTFTGRAPSPLVEMYGRWIAQEASIARAAITTELERRHREWTREEFMAEVHRVLDEEGIVPEEVPA